MARDEIELKFLEIDKEETQQQLLELGAAKKWSHELVSVGFDGPGLSLRGANDKQVLRVRQIGEDVYITHKGPSTSTQYKTREETEIVTHDLQDAIALLTQLGFIPGEQTKKHRTHYEMGDVHFEIDTVPGIPPYLEIETHSEQRMREVCEQLGLEVADGKNKTINLLYPEELGF